MACRDITQRCIQMCVHTRAHVASFVQEETKLLLVTAIVLKAEQIFVFAEVCPKLLHKAKDETGHSFI